MPKIKKHIHKFKRANIGGPSGPYLVYKCTLPTCTSYYPCHLTEGKLTICNRCGETMVMTKLAMTLALPHCLDCTKTTKKKETIGAIEEFLEDLEME